MNAMKHFVTTFFLWVIAGLSVVNAETLYVTDKVLLGVHQEPKVESLLLKSIPSGTAVEVVERYGNFTKIKQADGAQGWVNSEYLIKDTPDIVKLSQLVAKHEQLGAQYKKATKNLESLRNELKKKERELQIQQDDLANARSSINDLRQRNKMQTPDAMNAQLQKEFDVGNKKIEVLQGRIIQLKSELDAQSIDLDMQELIVKIQNLEDENHMLQTRIDVAQANLTGENIPSPEELAIIRPKFPSWYWGLLAVMIIIGFILGLISFDYLYRKRHGGFRI